MCLVSSALACCKAFLGSILGLSTPGGSFLLSEEAKPGEIVERRGKGEWITVNCNTLFMMTKFLNSKKIVACHQRIKKGKI
jgi:hypothetical protein